MVTVTTDVGTMNAELVEGPIRQGNVAMYFPEANILVPGKVDPQLKTPSFKRTSVTINKIMK